LSTFQHSAN